MKFTPEQLAKAKTCKSVEELLSYANEIGYPLTEEQAKKQFEVWNKEGELADEELENVSGGSFVYGCSTYSSEWPYYLITTAGNSCDSYSEMSPGIPGGVYGTCWRCSHVHLSENGAITYCHERKYGSDRYNP